MPPKTKPAKARSDYKDKAPEPPREPVTERVIVRSVSLTDLVARLYRAWHRIEVVDNGTPNVPVYEEVLQYFLEDLMNDRVDVDLEEIRVAWEAMKRDLPAGTWLSLNSFMYAEERPPVLEKFALALILPFQSLLDDMNIRWVATRETRRWATSYPTHLINPAYLATTSGGETESEYEPEKFRLRTNGYGPPSTQYRYAPLRGAFVAGTETVNNLRRRTGGLYQRSDSCRSRFGLL
jgi:hypothetical protein